MSSRGVGTRLGPYEITAAIGAGGMGEVFRARDTKLGRDVAIKVLPAAFVQDADRVARFRREAQVLASLNHPNIAAIYGLEEANGAVALALELVEGVDLADRLKRGAIPVDEAIAIAKQIAEGLEAAHEKGIVHRDLKPANVKLTRDDAVKILDFGLAKAYEGDGGAAGASGEVSNSPTLSRHMTEAGMILGTAAYMSPEQARGKPVDKRADIWAFGVVFFEMLSGRPLFRGETVSDTLAAVLRQDVAWSQLPKDVPPAVRRLIERCLERDPRRRLRDIGEARLQFEDRRAEARSGTPMPRAVVAGALAAGAIALFVAGRYAGSRAATAPPAPHAVSFTQVTDQPGVETMPSLSPDGKSVVYAKTVGASGGLYLLRVGSRNPVPLTPDSTSSDREPAFSPDGERIAFRSEREGGGVFLMGVSGESITRLTDFGYFPSWSPDGAEIVVSPDPFVSPTGLFSENKGLSIVNVKSGQRRALPIDARALQPNWSPKGHRIAYWGVRGQSGQRDIWTVAADGSDAATGGVAVTNDPALDWSPAWSPDGRYLYFASTRGGTMNLWRVAIDEGSGRVAGEPEPMTVPATWSGHLSFSRDGTRLALASLDYRSTLLSVPFDAARETVLGPPVPIIKGTRAIRDHELSPDGEWVAFTEAGVQEDLFVARIDGAQYRRLTDDGFRDRGPAWSPDGTKLAFYSDRSGAYELWTIRPDGSGLAQLTHGTGVSGFPVWSPDGARMVAGFSSWFFVDTLSPSSTPPSLEPPIGPNEWFLPASWSPIGGRIAGQVLDRGRPDASLSVYTVATKRFARVPADSAHGAMWLWPVWLADGRRMIVRRPEGVAVVNADTGASHLVLAVGGDMIGHTVGVSRDNRRITYTETATEGDIWIATLQ